MNDKKTIFNRRIYSFLIDFGILLILDSLISVLFPFKGLFSYTYEKIDIYLIPKISIIALFYYALLESSSLQASFGKKMMGLKVVDYDNKKISLFASFLRSISRLVSLSVFGLGIIVAFFNINRLTFHDKITKTKIIAIQ